MALFDKEKMSNLVGSAKDLVKNTTEKASKAFSESSEQMKKFSEESKKLKAPVEGAITRYEFTYAGGLAQYPKLKAGAIGVNILEDCFYLKPTTSTIDWFEEMAIPYAKISKLQIVKRKISNAEWLLSSSNSDMKAMEQENIIEISYKDADDKNQVLRLEMLTGVSIYGQAGKCVEFMDVLRQNNILDKFAGEEKKQESSGGQEDVLAQIEKLAKLKESGILTEEEFAQKKAELLAKM